MKNLMPITSYSCNIIKCDCGEILLTNPKRKNIIKCTRCDSLYSSKGYMILKKIANNFDTLESSNYLNI